MTISESTSISTENISKDKLISTDNETMLWLAVRSGNLAAAKHIIEESTSSGLESALRYETWGRSCLHLAVQAGDVEMLRLLLVVGADVDSLDADGFTGLQRAAADRERMQLDVVKVLVRNGADVNRMDIKKGVASPLH
ncbi:hypothetical protein QAD02_023953, partial [Eretmocerus hayati]